MGDIAIPFNIQGDDVVITTDKANQIKYFAKLSYDPDPLVTAARLRNYLKNAGIEATVQVQGDEILVYYEESVVTI